MSIKGVGYLSDPEFMEFLYAKYDPRALDFGFPFYGATEITIHKGEFAPVKTNEQNDDCYGFMSAP